MVEGEHLPQPSHPFAGLNELVPENLLAIFDENELEVGYFRSSFYHVLHNDDGTGAVHI